MSWSGYITALVDSGKINHAAIIGLSDRKIYGVTEGLSLDSHVESFETEKGSQSLEVNDLSTLFSIFQTKGKVQAPPGIWINKERYHLINFVEESSSAYLKCPNGGATVIKTEKLIVLTTWSNVKDVKKNGGDCNQVLEEFAEQLRSVNY